MADLTVSSAVDTLMQATNEAGIRTAAGVVIGTDVQAYSALLAAIAGLTPTDGVIIVGNGTTFVSESGATARTSLGLGSAAVEDASAFATAAQGALADSALQAGDVGTAAAADTGDFATAAQGATADSALQPGDEAFAIVTESTTARTLALTDSQKYIRCTNGSAATVTIAPQADVSWAADTEIIIEQAGAGQVTIAAGTGVTLRTSQTAKTAAQYSCVTLKRVASDEWVLGGEREASA